MYTISSIHIYPIKSLGGISLQSAVVTPKGLQYDRRYMLVRPDGSFITQREKPILALFALQIADNEFIVDYNTAKINIPRDGEDWKKLSKKVQIWKSNVTAYLAPDAINQWFSEKIGEICYLCYLPDKSQRRLPPLYAGKGQTVSFADGYPMLLANTASIADLNARMTSAVRLDRFRANLVFEGTIAWEEDCWTGFSIGKARYKCAKPCARCIMVNTDQQKGTRSPEVLKTLATFRRSGNKVLFGENVVWENWRDLAGATIRVGDVLELWELEEKTPMD